METEHTLSLIFEKIERIIEEYRDREGIDKFVLMGNILSGKTTQIDKLVKHYKNLQQPVLAIKENTEKWSTLLTKFYTRKTCVENNTSTIEIVQKEQEDDIAHQNIPFLLQDMIIDHYNEIPDTYYHFCEKNNNNEKTVTFIERSIFDVFRVFMKANLELFTEEQFNQLCNKVTQHMDKHQHFWKQCVFLYLNVQDISVLWQRKTERQNCVSGDSQLSIPYLERISTFYTSLFEYLQSNSYTVIKVY